MDSSDTSPATSSTVTTTTIDSTTSKNNNNFHVLEISLISAQDLPQISKTSMRTYAVAWINPRHKLTSSIDPKGNANPTWNDKFAFSVDNEYLISENSSVTIEIYHSTSSWFKYGLVGTVRVLISDLITPSAMNSTRFVALQIRRPSGKFQGKLNMGVALMDGSNGTLPPFCEIKSLTEDNVLDVLKKNGDVFDENHEKMDLWQSHSLGHDEVVEEFPEKGGGNGSMVDGSMCNASELCSDVGPSASVVATEIAQRSLLLQPIGVASGGRGRGQRAKEAEDLGSSIVEEMTIEEATTKGLRTSSNNLVTRSKKEVPFPPILERNDNYDVIISDHKSKSGHLRRHSDGGLFSCFGNTYGFEFTIVCGASNKPNFKESTRSKKRPSGSSEATSA